MASKRNKRRRSCDGKVRHASSFCARIALRKMHEPGMQVYQCQFCGGYHIGHLDRLSKIAKKKMVSL